ncbi:hypothetical protein ACVWYN_000425 [Pedobacter sp. UYP24]
MNENKLTLAIKLRPENMGTITMGIGKFRNSITGVVNILRFVGNLKHLTKMITLGADLDCGYEIKDSNGLEWVLSCKVNDGKVGLNLWFQGFGAIEKLENLFDWAGTKEEFDDAISRMLTRLGRYKWFAW